MIEVRKLVAAEHVSLDGVMEAPERWRWDYDNDEINQAIGAGFAASDALLMGRVLYEEWAPLWSKQDPEENPFAAQMNGLAKYVVSDSLEEPLDWQNSTLIEGEELVKGISDLKRQEGKDIVVSGSGALVRSLLREGTGTEGGCRGHGGTRTSPRAHRRHARRDPGRWAVAPRPGQLRAPAGG